MQLIISSGWLKKGKKTYLILIDMSENLNKILEKSWES